MTPRERCLQAISSAFGNAKDDLARAEARFKLVDDKRMNEEYGQSGRTPAQILEEYRASVAEWQAALDWFLK